MFINGRTLKKKRGIWTTVVNLFLQENINPLSTLNTTYRTVITISLGIKPFYEIGKAISKLQPLLKHPHLEINSCPAHMHTQPTAKGKPKKIK